jgi:hypothetical protein
MSSVVISGDTSGTVTLQAPATAGSTILTLPSTSGTVITSASLTSSGIAQLAVAETFTAPQRGSITTDNDLSFDLSAGNNFTCTPTGTGTLTFTNHVAGQSGYVLLINSGGYAISAAATTKVGTNLLATVSTAGTYLISYYDNGTNAYLTASGALS